VRLREPLACGPLQRNEKTSRIDAQEIWRANSLSRLENAVEIGEGRQDDVVVLRPVGRINNDTSGAFQKRLLACVDPGGGALLVDLSGVDYISSAGLRALMTGSKHAKASGGRLAVAGLTPIVKEIFAISRFSHVVPVFETPAEAVAALR
jgi:anti-anti-sigma factor